ALRRGRHVLPQGDALARVEAGLCHQIEAERVGLALLRAAELEHDTLRGETERRLGSSVQRTRRVARRPEQPAQDLCAALCQGLIRYPLRAVARQHVADLVA